MDVCWDELSKYECWVAGEIHQISQICDLKFCAIITISLGVCQVRSKSWSQGHIWPGLHQDFQVTSGTSNVKTNLSAGNEEALVHNHHHPEPTNIHNLSQRSTLTIRTERVIGQPGSESGDSITKPVRGYDLKSCSGSLACVLHLRVCQGLYTQHFCSN